MSTNLNLALAKKLRPARLIALSRRHAHVQGTGACGMRTATLRRVVASQAQFLPKQLWAAHDAAVVELRRRHKIERQERRRGRAK